MTELHPKLIATIYALRQMLGTHKGKLHCTGCHTEKTASRAWGVGVFVPNRHHKAGAYLICPVCVASQSQRQKSARYAETALRDLAESEGA